MESNDSKTSERRFTHAQGTSPRHGSDDVDSSKVNETMHSAKETAKETAELVKDTAAKVATDQLDQGVNTVADQVSRAEGVIQSIAHGLRESDQGGLATYADDLASRAASLSGSLRDRSAEELITEAGRYARRNPGLFIAGSVIAGFALSRFFRASGARATEWDNTDQSSAPWSGESSRLGGLSEPAHFHHSTVTPQRPTETSSISSKGDR